VVEASVLERSGVGVVVVVVVLMAAVLLLLLLEDEAALAAEVEFPVIIVISVALVEFAMLASICIRVLEVGAVVVMAAMPGVAVAVPPATSDWATGEFDVVVDPSALSPPRVAIRPPPPIRKDCSSHG